MTSLEDKPWDMNTRTATQIVMKLNHQRSNLCFDANLILTTFKIKPTS